MFFLYRIFCKLRLYAQFMNRLNEHTEIMAEYLAQYLIQLSDIAFTPYRITKFGLDHAKGRLDVGPLMVMR